MANLCQVLQQVVCPMDVGSEWLGLVENSTSSKVDCCVVWPRRAMIAYFGLSDCALGGKQGHDYLPGGGWDGLNMLGHHVVCVDMEVAQRWAWVHRGTVELCPSDGLCTPRGYGGDSGLPLKAEPAQYCRSKWVCPMVMGSE